MARKENATAAGSITSLRNDNRHNFRQRGHFDSAGRQFAEDREAERLVRRRSGKS
jgi:hypothetical protein